MAEDSKRYALSTDEETFYGNSESLEEAIATNMACDPIRQRFWIGEVTAPSQPEDFWHAEDWLEHVSCQDEYSGDYADGWDGSTKEQREQLTIAVRSLMGVWLDKHKLRPQFFNVKNVQEYRVVDGKPELVTRSHAIAE